MQATPCFYTEKETDSIDAILLSFRTCAFKKLYVRASWLEEFIGPQYYDMENFILVLEKIKNIIGQRLVVLNVELNKRIPSTCYEKMLG